MAAKKSAKKRSTSTTRRAESSVFTAEERAAMREHAQEVRAARGSRRSTDDDARAVLEKIASFTTSDRAMAERIHAIVMATAPELAPKLWYGMPAYARDGQVICFFQGAQKFKTRYSTLGFSDKAALDDGRMWPTSYALMTDLTAADEARIAALVQKATS